eukprot:scaffold28967_cov66-Phaeocystis_antarctica.AAC.4
MCRCSGGCRQQAHVGEVSLDTRRLLGIRQLAPQAGGPSGCGGGGGTESEGAKTSANTALTSRGFSSSSTGQTRGVGAAAGLHLSPCGRPRCCCSLSSDRTARRVPACPEVPPT